MTPEERASATIREWELSPPVASMAIDDYLEDIIAKAIRSAELDERAACSHAAVAVGLTMCEVVNMPSEALQADVQAHREAGRGKLVDVLIHEMEAVAEAASRRRGQ